MGAAQKSKKLSYFFRSAELRAAQGQVSKDKEKASALPAAVFLLFTGDGANNSNGSFHQRNNRLKAGKFAGAIREYVALLKQEPAHAPTLTNRGVAKGRLKTAAKPLRTSARP